MAKQKTKTMRNSRTSTPLRNSAQAASEYMVRTVHCSSKVDD